MKAKNKKILAGSAALALAAALAVGGTFAYLTDETEKRANNFSFPEPISAMLTEPDWDGVVDYLYPDDPDFPAGVTDKDVIPVYGWTTDDTPKPIFGYKDGTTQVTNYGDDGTGTPPAKTGEEYGNTTNQNMVPGQIALKDPIITNTSKDIDEWVAAQVSFVYASGTNEGKLLSETDMASVLAAIDIDWDFSKTSNKWNIIGATEITADSRQYTFYYGDILNKRPEGAKNGTYGDSTAPIFTSVKVKDTAVNSDIEKLNKIEGGFYIYIEGFAAQSSVAAAYGDFAAWANTGVVFNNSPSDTVAADLSKDNGGIVAKQ